MAQPLRCDAHNQEHLADILLSRLDDGSTVALCHLAYVELAASIVREAAMATGLDISATPVGESKGSIEGETGPTADPSGSLVLSPTHLAHHTEAPGEADPGASALQENETKDVTAGEPDSGPVPPPSGAPANPPSPEASGEQSPEASAPPDDGAQPADPPALATNVVRRGTSAKARAYRAQAAARRRSLAEWRTTETEDAESPESNA